MTLLEAINVLLSSIGEQPIVSIPIDGVSLGTIAKTKLEAVSRRIQGQGLWCNSETEWPFVPDATSGQITFPSNLLKFTPTYSYLPYVKRGTRLYDFESKTYVFGSTVYGDVVWLMDFEDLPEHVANLIVWTGAREFQMENLGSEELLKYTNTNLQEAYREFKSTEESYDTRTYLNAPGISEYIRRGF
jgi:hypothetical protein